MHDPGLEAGLLLQLLVNCFTLCFIILFTLSTSHGIYTAINLYPQSIYTSFNPLNWSTIMVSKTSAVYYNALSIILSLHIHHRFYDLSILNVWPSTKYTSIHLYS